MVVGAVVIIALCVVGCRQDKPLERLPPPRDEIELTVPRAPPPPPPPGGHTEDLTGPPEELAPLLAAQDEPVVVKVIELTEGAARSTTLGYGIKRMKPLEPGLAAALVARLARDDAFVDGGEYTCVGEPLGLNLSRASIVREVIVDCGHMYFTPQRHAGRYVLVAPELNAFIYSVARSLR
jgi:hypothetical protein